MKVPIKWLKQYANVDGSPDDIANKIRSQLAEVEKIEDYNEKYKDIVVAEVKTAKPHPQADKLNVYTLDTGQKEDIQVVAGGVILNVKDKVAYMPPGTKLPFNPAPEKYGDHVQASKLRGILSNGMIASAKELDYALDHTRVMLVQTNAKPGTPIAQALEMDDLVLDIENKALTNRADCFGIIGVAREISGIHHIAFKTPEWLANPETNKPETPEVAELPVELINESDVNCPRIMLVSIKDVEVKDSPNWMKALLNKAGMRPINNIVDIANYLMLLTGQPLHTYDYDKVVARDPNSDGKAHITVRQGKEGEKVTTLDQKTVEVSTNTVVITDSTSAIGIGGVMGGLADEVTENTKNLIIECANFHPYNIRKTTMELGIFTEAATRFIRGQDPNQCEAVLYKAVELIKELANGTPASPIYDNYIDPVKPKTISISVKRANGHIGIELTKEEIIKLLTNVELIVSEVNQDPDALVVTAPTFRRDLAIAQDIHEEIARLNGYDNIPLTLPTRDISAVASNKRIALVKELRKVLISAGASEILNYSFTSGDRYKALGLDIEKTYRLINALSPELEYMRMLMTPSVAEKVVDNIRRGYQEFAIFEINKVHNKAEKDPIEPTLPLERTNLALVYTVADEIAKATIQGSAYYQIKHYADYLVKKLSLPKVSYELISEVDSSALPAWLIESAKIYDTNRSAILSVKLGKSVQYIGIAGEFSAKTKDVLSLPQYTSALELTVEDLLIHWKSKNRYQEPSRFPKVQNDYCFVVASDTRVGDIVDTATSAVESPDLRTDVKVLDIYQTDDKSIKQVTIRVELQHREMTLTEKEIEGKRKKLVEDVKRKVGGVLKE